VLPSTYDGQNCSIARSLEVLGERWTLLILRDALRGTTRFSDFQASLGVARNVLTTRLNRLCEAGLMVRHAYQERPRREEYLLTEKGRAANRIVVELLRWGDRFAAPHGPPVVLVHTSCGEPLDPDWVCGSCGEPVAAGQVLATPGPGARAGTS
jgi:DNA-binding HxlR family transcriptional regulator